MSFFPRGVLDEILNLIESVSEGFPSYSYQRYKDMNGQDEIFLVLEFIDVFMLTNHSQFKC